MDPLEYGEGELRAELTRVEDELRQVIAERRANTRPEIDELFEGRLDFLREIRLSILVELDRISRKKSLCSG